MNDDAAVAAPPALAPADRLAAYRSRRSRIDGVTDPVASDLPSVALGQPHPVDANAPAVPGASTQPPRFLVLYGSIRERSSSGLLSEEAGRLLRRFGCEMRIFDLAPYRFPTGRSRTIRRSRDCATAPTGPRAWSGSAAAGSDRGPKSTPIGSLATPLRCHVLAGKGRRITSGQSRRVGLALTQPLPLATRVAPWARLPVASSP